MGRNSGGSIRRANIEGDSTYKGKIENVESLIHVKDPRMYKVIKEAIARFAAKLGIPERNVKLADLDGDTMGAGVKGSVYLNKAYFNMPVERFARVMERAYNRGHLTSTDKPLAHVVTHELSHGYWTSDLQSFNARRAGNEIRALYRTFKKDAKSRRQYGTYAAKNVDEFWAEVSTKAAHGKSDKYTKAVKAIYQKYKL